MNKLNRRGFIRTGISGAAGIVSLSPFAASASNPSTVENTICRTLGKTGLKIPVVSFGVMRADNPNLCKAAYENGIKLFDTAHSYQNGNNETMLGNLFKDFPRESFFLATKVKPIELDKEGRPTKQTTAGDFLSKFNTSLGRLKMDYVDILYVHIVEHPDLVEYKPIIKVMQQLKKEGRIRFMGLSTHKNEAAVINAATDSGNWDVILTAYNFMQTYQSEVNSAIRKASEAGIGIIAMKTMAGGGFFDKEKTKPVNTTAAIKWALSNPGITTTIPGMTDFGQLDNNLKILSDITLTDAERNDLVVPIAENGLYCNSCSKCVPACRLNLPVPELMRAYMYAYGYSAPAMAHSLLGELGTGSDPCRDCNACQVKCIKNFAVKDKITDISRLVNVPPEFLS